MFCELLCRSYTLYGVGQHRIHQVKFGVSPSTQVIRLKTEG